MVTNEPQLIVCEEENIFRPKPKKLYNSRNAFSEFDTHWFNKKPCHNQKKSGDKKKRDSKISNKSKDNIKSILKESKKKEYDFDLFSEEEINNDFKDFKARSEVIKVENELLKILSNSTKETSLDEEEYKKIEKLEKARNSHYKKFD